VDVGKFPITRYIPNVSINYLYSRVNKYSLVIKLFPYHLNISLNLKYLTLFLMAFSPPPPSPRTLRPDDSASQTVSPFLDPIFPRLDTTVHAGM